MLAFQYPTKKTKKAATSKQIMILTESHKYYPTYLIEQITKKDDFRRHHSRIERGGNPGKER